MPSPRISSEGWFVDPGDMFSVRVDYKSAEGFKWAPEFEKYTTQSAKDRANTTVSTAGEYLLKRLRAKLEPPPKGEHGASGKARDNIFLDVKDTAKGTTATISEGPYPGNAFIRQGRKSNAQAIEAGNYDQVPTVGEIVNWMIEKQIPFRQPKRQKKWRITKAGGLRAREKSKPIRPWKADLRLIALIVATKIDYEGIKPYDYYADVFRNDFRTLENKIDRVNLGLMKVYIDYLKTGFYRPHKGSSQLLNV